MIRLKVFLTAGFLTGCLFFSQKAWTQSKSSEPLKPILLDKSALSGIGLKKVELKNEPERDFFQKNLYRGEDISVYIVSSQSWPGTMNNFPIDEYVYIFNGKSRAQPKGGKDIFFQTGEHFAIPKGYTGEWEVMAGNQYHYELSVITTQRAPEAKISKAFKPQLFDKNKLSGLNFDLAENETHQEVLFEGDELKISLLAEAPRSISLNESSKEQLIHVMSGQISIKDSEGQNHPFFTGDFLVIPKGFIGKWVSQGHGLVKFLVIEKGGI